MPAYDSQRPRRVAPIWPALVSIATLVGCSDIHLSGAPPEYRFMQRQHRETYGITEADMARLQFSVSNRVVAQDVDTPGAEGLILVPAGTPGRAIAAGPRWIRVQFQKGGEGVVFLANPATYRDTTYVLATEAADSGDGYRQVRDIPDHVIQTGGRRYRIVEGWDAELLVDGDTLKKLVETRRTVAGQRIPED
jgi:hypothetical protein